MNCDEEKENVVELDQEILENFVRSLLKENNISHLDALIMSMQAINALVSCLKREFGQEKLMEVLDAADEKESQAMQFVAFMNIKLSEEISKIQEKKDGV